MELVEVCALQDIPPGSTRAARAGTKDIALFNLNGELHAIENSCLHQGMALSGGKLCGNIVACPAHGWKYDVTSGALVVAPQLKLKKFAVQVADGKILVEVEA